MIARRIDPLKPVTTFDIVGLTQEEMRAILCCLKHASGGHLALFYEASDGFSSFSIPGTLYNNITAALGANEDNLDLARNT